MTNGNSNGPPDFVVGARNEGVVAVKQSSLAIIIAAMEEANPPSLEAFKDAIVVINECGCLPPCDPNDPNQGLCDGG